VTESGRQESRECDRSRELALEHPAGCRCGFCVDWRLVDRDEERRYERRADDRRERRLWT
jgi:hypothetical protein